MRVENPHEEARKSHLESMIAEFTAKRAAAVAAADRALKRLGVGELFGSEILLTTDEANAIADLLAGKDVDEYLNQEGGDDWLEGAKSCQVCLTGEPECEACQ